MDSGQFDVTLFSCFSAMKFFGGLAQLARALAWHARGHRFDPDILHFGYRSGISGSIVRTFYDIL